MKKNMTLSISIIITFILLAVNPAFAEVGFDGLKWYISENPEKLTLNEHGHLVWQDPHAPEQVTVHFPPIDLSDVGDVAEVVYLVKTEGENTGEVGTDPMIISGTGDLRIGIFDSNGAVHVKKDGYAYRAKRWCGYLGYCARICPHLQVGIKREHSDAIPGKIQKRIRALMDGSCESLVQSAGSYRGSSKDISGFDLKFGQFSPLVLKLERKAVDKVVFSITLNNTTYYFEDDEGAVQPKKIDTLALYYPNPKNIHSIAFAKACSSEGGPAAKVTGPTIPGQRALADPKQPDYTSRVPKFIFADTLEEQQAQLLTNPLMERFAKSRRKMAGDRYRPIYHYVNPEGKLNDGNGLCFWKGRWHLFYQAYPPEDTRQHWGHAVSDDLIHWRDLPYAIYPHPEKKCYSGSALVEEDRVIAMYHGTEVGNMVAVSSDPLLLNWAKVTGKAVIPMRSPDGSPLPYRVYDPCIWKKGGMYFSLSGGTLPGPGGKRVRANFLFRSKDLAKWQYLHPFIEDDRFTLVGDDGACPYFWPIGERHILLFFSHMSGGQYLLGDYDKERDKFVATSHGYFNFGAAKPSGVHAPTATPDGKGGVIVIFNMNPGKRTEGWNQIMTLPRRLTLIAKDEMGVEPAGDIKYLRYDHQQVKTMTLAANQEVVLENIRGNALEIIAEIDPKNAPMIEMNVLRSPNGEESTRIMFFHRRWYRGESVVAIDSSRSSILADVRSRAPEMAPVSIDENELLKLRVFVDRSVVEAFVNGRQCVALRVYPGREDSIGVSLRSQGQDAVLKSLDAWQMKNIYK